MPRRPPEVTLTTLSIDRRQATPLHRQLYDGVRSMILAGQLQPGTRLPSTRGLAAELGLARATVQNAFEQLLAEGYVQGKVGSGTYVAQDLPEQAWLDSPRQVRVGDSPGRALSERGTALTQAVRAMLTRPAVRGNAFRLGLSALDVFPFAVWGRLQARQWRLAGPERLRYQPPAGYEPLRQALAAYLGPARGVRCSAEQVIITAGSQQALDLAARVLLNPGESAWCEDPGYLGARAALIAAGVRLVPVPVDSEGLDVSAGQQRAPQARLAYVSPSHQFPLGATLSLARRLALLDWARRAAAWVLEDDYDSEYRFAGRPLAALQGLDSDGRVIYIGTFSKTLFPALRLGYLVVPPDLVDAFSAARYVADRHSSILEQATLAEFISEGHFARHIRRMRKLYADRQAALLEAAQGQLAGRLELAPAETGMHLVGWLPDGTDAAQVTRRAAEHGIEVAPLSWYCSEARCRPALLLGYGGVGVEEIRAGVRQLAQVLP